jgi:hypothetical protein
MGALYDVVLGIEAQTRVAAEYRPDILRRLASDAQGALGAAHLPVDGRSANNGSEKPHRQILIEHSDWSNAADTLAKLKPINDSIHNFRKCILPARKWFIAHHDLSAVRLGGPLGAASDAEWKQFWLDLQDFLDLLVRHHVDPNSHFYLNGIAGMSDADSLLTALRNAKLFEAVMDDQEIAARALRAADTSRFAGDL